MSGTLIFGQNRTANSLHAVEVDTDGVVAVDIHAGGTGSGDLKARTAIADPATSTFLKCNADGTLDISVAIDETGLATDANQTNGNQLAKVGNTVGDGTGTGTFLKTATDGSVHVVVENSDNVLIKGVQDGTTTQKDAKTNSNGDLRSALIGNTAKDGTGTNYYVLVDSDGKLETSGGGGGGGDATAANQTLQLAQETTTATNTSTIAGAVSGNEFQCDIVSSVLPAGASTSANQSLQLAQETVTATNSSSIDNKITQGSDVTLTNAQQVLCYGRDNAGALDALRTDASGHLEITIDDFVKGQATMANSFPVVIASDQNDLTTTSAQLPVSLGQKANSGSLSICRSTTAGAFDMSARTTIATAGTSTKLLCDSAGVLQIQPLRDADATAISITPVLANGTFTSTSVDMNGFSQLTIIGSTTNLTDQMDWYYSFDDVTFFKGAQVLYDFLTGDFAEQPNNGAGVGGARYLRVAQTDSTASNFTVNFASSKR